MLVMILPHMILQNPFLFFILRDATLIVWRVLREAGVDLINTDDLAGGQKFLQAEAGITGVNFAIAETGGFVVCTNEGNADLGVSLGYHNHMGSLGERPEEVDQIVEAADPRYARLELDVAHYFQGGGDPVKAIEKYSDRLLFLHIKDVEPMPEGADSKRPYRFVELGRGKVDLPAVFGALHKVNFRGWAIVELDAVPDKTRTPKESGAISRKYLEEKVGVTI